LGLVSAAAIFWDESVAAEGAGAGVIVELVSLELEVVGVVDRDDIESLPGLLWLHAASEVATARPETRASADCVIAFMLHSPSGCEGKRPPAALP